MKHVTYADRSLLVGDEAADALMEYARVLADNGRADTVVLSAMNADGNTVNATFLLSASTPVMVESTNSEVHPPDNEGVAQDIRDRIADITRVPTADTGEPWMDSDLDVRDPF
jgi:hypothetical protein